LAIGTSYSSEQWFAFFAFTNHGSRFFLGNHWDSMGKIDGGTIKKGHFPVGKQNYLIGKLPVFKPFTEANPRGKSEAIGTAKKPG
jgi:hypothetical protein